MNSILFDIENIFADNVSQNLEYLKAKMMKSQNSKGKSQN
jgi:hypothetical protein